MLRNNGSELDGNEVLAVVANQLRAQRPSSEITAGDRLTYLQALIAVAERDEHTTPELQLPAEVGVLDFIGRHPELWGAGDVLRRAITDPSELRAAQQRFKRGGGVAQQDWVAIAGVLELLCDRNVVRRGSQGGVWERPFMRETFVRGMRDVFKQEITRFGDTSSAHKNAGRKRNLAAGEIDPELPFAYLVLGLAPHPKLHQSTKVRLQRTLRMVAQLGIEFTIDDAYVELVDEEGAVGTSEFRSITDLRSYLTILIKLGWFAHERVQHDSDRLLHGDRLRCEMKSLPVVAGVPAGSGASAEV